MAIGTITVNKSVGASTPRFEDLLSFPGDGAYPTGGTADFEGSVRAKLGDNREVVAVVGQDCGGYVPVYDKATDKLKVYYANNDGGADGPLIEVPNNTNLAAVTFVVLVHSI